jgi:hypothetical protein
MPEPQIKYDGMPTPRQEAEPEINEDEQLGFILRKTADRSLTFEDVKAVLDAETEFLIKKGFIDVN